LEETVKRILRLGCCAGVAVNPASSLETLRENAPIVDMVLVMSGNPGYSGECFIVRTTDKIRRARRMVEQLNPTRVLQVDAA
jgi:ribulose-phosphate 3-epimerase